jgi:hypothetical protein
MKPGDTCDKLRATYGKESSHEGPAHTWEQDIVKIVVLVIPNGPCVAGTVNYYIQPGHTFRTRDGIILGRDTIAEAGTKLKGRIGIDSYMSIRWAGKAYGQLVTQPISAFPFKSTYSWQLNQAATQKLKDPPKLTDFTNEPAILYTIDHPDPQ